jgi:Short C-terminal domain
VRDAGGTGGTADDLADLKERGVISDAEFADQKAKILS